MTDVSGVDPKVNWTGIGAAEPAIAAEADEKAAAKFQRRGQLLTLPEIKGNDDYEALSPGMKFKDPTGNVRTKPYKVTSDEDYDEIPEGAQFLDPKGQLRTKPKYEDIDFTSQTLYDMSVNDTERRKSLERSYPGKVKERGGKFYIDDDGTLRRPKGFTEGGALPALASAAAPTIGSVAGEIIGGSAGTAAEPGGGTFVGAVLGSAKGAAAGQFVNDVVLGLAGIYDRPAAQEAEELGLSAAFGLGGTAIGRGLSAIHPVIKDAVQQAAPKAVSYILGADPEAIPIAAQLQKEGVMVPPSTVYKEAPHIVNIAETFDPAFRQWKPLLTSATDYYERSAGKILEDLGVKSSGKISEPTAAPTTQKAGEALLQHRLQTQAVADARLDTALKDAEVQATLGSIGQKATQKMIDSAAAESRKAAEGLIDEGFKTIQAGVNDAMRVAKAGHNSGDLWQAVGDQLMKVRQGIVERAKLWYGQADRAAAGHLPNTEDLPALASEFLEQLPEPFKAKYPDAVKRLSDLAGKTDETGNVIKEPVHPTFGQLHELRTWFRSNVNWYDLTPDIRQGVYKLFARHIDDALHDAEAVPELQLASQLLDATDKWYGEQIRPFQDRNIEAVIKGLESGLPADPKVLFDTLIKEGRSDLTRKVADLIGPNLWAGVKAADVQQMLDASKTLVPDVIDGNTFAREVLSRERTGMLEAVHGKEASAQLMKQAQNIAMLNGKLDVHVRPGDKIADVIAKARAAADVAKAQAKKDPLAMLNREMKKIRADHARQLAKTRKADLLGFLYNPTVGAADAVDKILGSEDMILAAAARFGEKSSEFKMLQQVYAQRILMGTIDPGTKLAKVSPEIQNLMFPGVTGAQMKLLARNMDFLLGSKAVRAGQQLGAGPSMAAFEQVEHPWSGPLGATGKYVPKLPGVDFLGRAALTKYYAFVTKLATSPALLRFVQKGLQGDEQAREVARQTVQRWMRTSGMVGAASGEALYQAPNQ